MRLLVPKKSLETMGIAVQEMSFASLHLAGTVLVQYCQRSLKPKERMLADFLLVPMRPRTRMPC